MIDVGHKVKADVVMKRIQTLLIVFLIGFFMAGVASARLYKWVDENGVVHFSDTRPRHSKNAGKVEAVSKYGEDGKLKVGYADYGSERRNSLGSSDRSTPTVELYSTSWCHYCKKAASFFRSKGISFTEYDIEKDRNAAQRKSRLDKGGKGVPFVVINGKGISGFSTSAYENALKSSR